MAGIDFKATLENQMSSGLDELIGKAKETERSVRGLQASIDDLSHSPALSDFARRSNASLDEFKGKLDEVSNRVGSLDRKIAEMTSHPHRIDFDTQGLTDAIAKARELNYELDKARLNEVAVRAQSYGLTSPSVPGMSAVGAGGGGAGTEIGSMLGGGGGGGSGGGGFGLGALSGGAGGGSFGLLTSPAGIALAPTIATAAGALAAPVAAGGAAMGVGYAAMLPVMAAAKIVPQVLKLAGTPLMTDATTGAGVLGQMQQMQQMSAANQRMQNAQQAFATQQTQASMAFAVSQQPGQMAFSNQQTIQGQQFSAQQAQEAYAFQYATRNMNPQQQFAAQQQLTAYQNQQALVFQNAQQKQSEQFAQQQQQAQLAFSNKQQQQAYAEQQKLQKEQLQAQFNALPVAARTVATAEHALTNQMRNTFERGAPGSAMAAAATGVFGTASSVGVPILAGQFNSLFPAVASGLTGIEQQVSTPQFRSQVTTWTRDLPAITTNLMNFGMAAGKTLGGLVSDFSPLASVMSSQGAMKMASLGTWLNSPAGMAKTLSLQESARPIISGFGQVIKEFFTGVGGTLTGPGGTSLAHGLTSFANFEPKLFAFIDKSSRELPALGTIFHDFASVIGSVIGPGSPFSGALSILSAFSSVLKAISGAMNTLGGAVGLSNAGSTAVSIGGAFLGGKMLLNRLGLSGIGGGAASAATTAAEGAAGAGGVGIISKLLGRVGGAVSGGIESAGGLLGRILPGVLGSSAETAALGISGALDATGIGLPLGALIAAGVATNGFGLFGGGGSHPAQTNALTASTIVSPSQISALLSQVTRYRTQIGMANTSQFNPFPATPIYSYNTVAGPSATAGLTGAAAKSALDSLKNDVATILGQEQQRASTLDAQLKLYERQSHQLRNQHQTLLQIAHTAPTAVRYGAFGQPIGLSKAGVAANTGFDLAHETPAQIDRQYVQSSAYFKRTVTSLTNLRTALRHAGATPMATESMINALAAGDTQTFSTMAENYSTPGRPLFGTTIGRGVTSALQRYAPVAGQFQYWQQQLQALQPLVQGTGGDAAAIRAFQRAHHLTADGIAGPATLAAGWVPATAGAAGGRLNPVTGAGGGAAMQAARGQESWDQTFNADYNRMWEELAHGSGFALSSLTTPGATAAYRAWNRAGQPMSRSGTVHAAAGAIAHAITTAGTHVHQQATVAGRAGALLPSQTTLRSGHKPAVDAAASGGKQAGQSLAHEVAVGIDSQSSYNAIHAAAKGLGDYAVSLLDASSSNQGVGKLAWNAGYNTVWQDARGMQQAATQTSVTSLISQAGKSAVGILDPNTTTAQKTLSWNAGYNTIYEVAQGFYQGSQQTSVSGFVTRAGEQLITSLGQGVQSAIDGQAGTVLNKAFYNLGFNAAWSAAHGAQSVGGGGGGTLKGGVGGAITNAAPGPGGPGRLPAAIPKGIPNVTFSASVQKKLAAIGGHERTDSGLDFGAPSAGTPVPAVLDGVVLSTTNWGGAYAIGHAGGIVYRTAAGDAYVMEDFVASVPVGAHVKAGQTIGTAYGQIEMGWANSAGTNALQGSANPTQAGIGFTLSAGLHPIDTGHQRVPGYGIGPVPVPRAAAGVFTAATSYPAVAPPVSHSPNSITVAGTAGPHAAGGGVQVVNHFHGPVYMRDKAETEKLVRELANGLERSLRNMPHISESEAQITGGIHAL